MTSYTNRMVEGVKAAPPEILLGLPFDHYQRYALTARLAGLLLPGPRAVKILDVGGHSGSLKHFIPEAQVLIADILPPPGDPHNQDVPFLHDGYVMASGAQIPFADATFDIVTAHDTLEHVPQPLRENFLHECLRVSRGFVVINGPVDHGEVSEREERIFKLASDALAWENPYLKEHIERGLPTSHWIEETLAGMGTPYTVIPNGSLVLWTLMMGLRHYLLALPKPERLQEAIDRAYNSAVSPRDFAQPCYRDAYVFAKDPAHAGVLHSFQGTINPPPVAAGPLGTSREALDLLLDALEEHAGEVRYEVSHLREWAARQDATIEDLGRSLADYSAELRVKNEMLARRELDIAGAEKRLEQTTAALSIARKELQAAESELAAIQASTGYRLLERYRQWVGFLFPTDSLRGIPYRAGVRAVRGTYRAARGSASRARGFAGRGRRIIRNEGWRSFTRKAMRKIASAIIRRPVRHVVLHITYREWIQANEPGAAELERQRAAAAVLPYRPLISLLTPVWNPDPRLLRETIESVLAQTYDNWELCVVDGASEGEEPRAVLRDLAAEDGRVRLVRLGENRGIAGNTNESLAMAGGDFVAFLDHTDLLAPNALWEVAALLNRDPGADCVYSDHDLISINGQRHSPVFKPAWSPEMLFSANYLAHFCVMRKSLVDQLGGLRREVDGAQDWDLALRLSRRTQRFARIPKVLYHWRADEASAVSSPDNKPYAKAAQERALAEHLAAAGIPASLERDEFGWTRVRWQTPSRARVSIIIPTRHKRSVLGPCLRSLARSAHQDFEVIVVDNGGRAPEHERWYERVSKELPLTVLWWEQPFNYSAVNNLAASAANGEVLLFLNDDTEALSADWLDEMLGWLDHSGVGVVGARLKGKNGRIQHGGDVLGMNGFADHLFAGAEENEWTLMGSTRWYRNFSAVTGACLMIRRNLFQQLGGFNDSFTLSGSDVELCLRVRRLGYRIICTPYANVLHHERATRGGFDAGEDIFTSYWYYQPYLHGGDPYFSPNLSLFSTVPKLRHPDEPKAPAIIAPALGRNLTPYKQGAAKMEEEAAALVDWCQVLPDEAEANKRLHETNAARFAVRSINWFIPDFESPFYGGLHTILRFADHFKRQHGVANRFIVLGTGPEHYVRSGIKAAFPSLEDCAIRVCSLAEEEIRAQPAADASIATLWVTAYAVSKFQNTKRKFYMVQDFEPVFYPAGTLYALSEATYRLGLYGLCNTHTLKGIYERDYGGKALGFVPAVDSSLFHPPDGPRHQDDTMVVFLYARPGHWRNCYELAIAALRRLKQRSKRRLRIVTAGSWVPSADSDSSYLVDNLGLLDYRETAALYRTCDVGLTLSVSKHPSYLPLELMASGALVVSNINPAGYWLLKDGENCLLAEPTAESLAAALERALNDDDLRRRLTERAVSDIRENYSDWAGPLETVYDFLCDPEGHGNH